MQSLLDQAVLDKLALDIGSETTPLVIDSVLQDLEVRWSKIELAEKNRDIEIVRAEAHALKSCVRSVGLMALGEAFAGLERAATHGSWSSVEEFMAQSRASLEPSRNALSDQI